MAFFKSLFRILAPAVIMLAFTPICKAEATEKDVQVIGRVIALLDNGPKGTVPIAAVLGSMGGISDSNTIATIIGAGKVVGPINLTASLVNYDQLDRTLAKVVFIPEGLSQSELEKVFAIAQQRKLITISTGDSCLKIQKCAITIISQPAVDIRLSVAASAATNVKFGSTFRMIIKEVH